MTISPDFRAEYVPVEQFRQEDYDKSSARIRDPLKQRNRTVFKRDLAVYPNANEARAAGLISGQIYVDNNGDIQAID